MKNKKNSILFGRADEPIISTLLEIDTYKFLMMYFIWTYVPEMKVTFGFSNRSIKIALGKHISLERLREELSAVKALQITDKIIKYLRGKNLFREEFLYDLKSITLPLPQIRKLPDSQLDIRVSGTWYQVTLWETIILSLVNQLYAENVIGYDKSIQERLIKEGEKRLEVKAERLRKTSIEFLQFGLRRRLSAWWEEHMTKMALELMPKNIIAVSNVALAERLNVSWGGTNAHELYSGFYALRSHEGKISAKYAQYEVLEKWQALYPENLRIMLPDTFGSEQFFNGLPQSLAESFRGARQDSGDPVVFGRMLIDMYQRLGIDPKTKTLIFSDGLDVAQMIHLNKIFSQKINVLFGWGTNFSNDTSLSPISIVMKLIEAAETPAIKLSDNLAKAIGDKEAITRAKEIFGYTSIFSKECRY